MVNKTPHKNARDRGRKTYFTGKPCKRGHIAPRYVTGMMCVECSRMHGKQWTQNNRERMRELQRDWAKRNQAYINKKQQEDRRRRYPHTMLKAAKSRAAELNVPFDLCRTDFTIPERCPVLGIPLSIHDGNRWTSPSFDRIIPEKGYVPGNIVVISQRANWIKTDATLEELKQIVDFYSKLITERAANSRNLQVVEP